MSPGNREPTWDVLIVAAAKGRADHGHRLRGELERLGLRVNLDLVPVSSVSDLPEDVIADARRAAVLVALVAAPEQSGDDLRESVGYLLASAPSITGRHPAEGEGAVGPQHEGNDVETGIIGADLPGLVERVAARVRRR